MFHPILLLGGLLVGLPILLHLIMKQEPKKLIFPAFRFLKQRQRINQRKIRLRHIILLAMRMLLIGLMALALFQPTLYSDRFNIRGEQPIATVLIIDTSPSMGYTVADRSRLDEAKTQILALLDQLPENSPVAILDTGDPVLDRDWLNNVADARKQVQSINGTKFVARPITSALDQAYRLLQKLDARQESSDPEAMARLITVFSDRTLSSWETERIPELEQQLQRIPPPEVNAVFIDVGVEKPINLAITKVQMTPQIVAADQPVVINVTLQATGQDIENVLVTRIDGEASADRQPIKIASGDTKVITIRRTGLKPGLHSAEISLFSPDSLMSDNVRFITFHVREPRQILTLVDDPADATVWQLAMKAFKMFLSEVKPIRDVVAWKPEEWNKYEVVCVMSVRKPGEAWGPLEEYMKRGGKVLWMPGGDEVLRDDFQNDIAKRIMPGELVKLIEADANVDVTWLWNSLNYQHPLLSPFREWQQQNNLDFIRFPPKVSRYWEVKPFAPEAVIVPYNDNDKHPALLERAVGRGRLLMFTTPMDARRDADDRFWNDYLSSSFYLVITNNSVRYLAGDTEDTTFNYLCGQSVTVPVPLNIANKISTFVLEGPGISGSDALVKTNSDGRLTIDREKTVTPGNFLVMIENRKIIDGFGLNTDPDESILERLPTEVIEGLFGAASVIPVEKGFNLSERLSRRFTQPVDLFPWLMILILFLYAGEGLLANRFYRTPKPTNNGEPG